MVKSVVTVTHEADEHKFEHDTSTLVNDVFNQSVKQFQLDPDRYHLTLSNNQPVDHSQSLHHVQKQHSNTQSANQSINFSLKPLQTGEFRSNQSIITLYLNDEQSTILTEQFTVNQSISDILTKFQAMKPDFPMLSYFGIPPVEKKTGFSLYVNIPGTVQSVVSIMDVDTMIAQPITSSTDPSIKQTNNNKQPIKQLTTDQAINETTLASLGYRSLTHHASKLSLKLSHQYTAPKMTEQQQQSIIENFQSKFDQAMNEVTDARMQNEELRKQKEAELLEEDRLIRINESKIDLPEDRSRRMFIAPIGIAHIPDLPDEFYEPTDEEKEAYAQSIINQAEKERAEMEALKNPAKAAKDAKLKAKKQSNNQTTKPKRKLKPAVNLIRVKMPDHLYIEALFKSHETVGTIRKFIQSMLADSLPSFRLFITPPKQTLDKDSATLAELKLFGSVLVHLSFDQPLDAVSHDANDHPLAAAARMLKPQFVDNVQILSPVSAPVETVDATLAPVVVEGSEVKSQ